MRAVLESLPPNSSYPSARTGRELALTGQHALVVRKDLDLDLPVETEVTPPPWQRPEWQQLWLALQKEDWRTLALVPSGDMPDGFTLEVAVSLVHTGSVHLGAPIRIADATDVSLGHLRQFIEELTELRDGGDRVIVALGPVKGAATTVPIAQASDRSLLCIPLEVSKVKDAKTTIKAVGPKHFVGSAVFEVG